jgi:drug/metabolite transporter (DMT)-like permease
MTRSRQTWVGVCCAVLSVLLFSGFTLASRAGLSTRLRPPDVAALRFGIGGLLLAPVLIRRGWGGVRRRDALALAFFGGLGFAFFAYTGFWLAPAAHGSVLLHGTVPITIGLGRFLIQAAVQGVLVGAVSIFVYSRAISILGPTVPSLFTAAVSCLTTLAAIPLLSEGPSLVVLSGVAAVTLGMIVSFPSGVRALEPPELRADRTVPRLR